MVSACLPGPPGCSGGELPAVAPVEAEVEQPAEVDGGGSDRQGKSVGVDAAVAAIGIDYAKFIAGKKSTHNNNMLTKGKK